MTEAKKIKGSCLCKAVSVSFEVKRHAFDACHCGMCRKWGGGPALSVDAAGDIQFTGEESIARYSSSEWAERGFCKQCGTHLFYHLKNASFYNFPLGLLENTEDFKFQTQIFIDRKPAGYSFAEKTELMTEAEVFAKYTQENEEDEVGEAFTLISPFL